MAEYDETPADQSQPDETVVEEYLLPLWIFEVAEAMMPPVEESEQEPDEGAPAEHKGA